MKTAVLALVFIFVWSVLAWSQPGLPQPPSQAPVDGGLSLLAAAGGAYAWRKLRAGKKA